MTEQQTRATTKEKLKASQPIDSYSRFGQKCTSVLLDPAGMIEVGALSEHKDKVIALANEIVFRWNEYDRLVDDVARLRKRITELETAAGNVMRYSSHVYCDRVHHGPGDEHGSNEPCPPDLRYLKAKSTLRALLDKGGAA